jgi:hypothetical protein
MVFSVWHQTKLSRWSQMWGEERGGPVLVIWTRNAGFMVMHSYARRKSLPNQRLVRLSLNVRHLASIPNAKLAHAVSAAMLASSFKLFTRIERHIPDSFARMFQACSVEEGKRTLSLPAGSGWLRYAAVPALWHLGSQSAAPLPSYQDMAHHS